MVRKFEFEGPGFDRQVPKVPAVRGTEDSDLDLVDMEDEDAETTIAPLRWPEPPRGLSERARGPGPDGVGLSRSVGPPSQPPHPRGSSLRSILVTMLILAAGFGLVLRANRLSFAPAAARRPPSVPAASAPPPPPAAPFTTILPRVPRGATQPAIDISSLPKAPPIAAPPRPQPVRILRPAVRLPVPVHEAPDSADEPRR
jgi:hypothetical protein